MKLLVATTRNCPEGFALVVMLATDHEVRTCEWASTDEASLIDQSAYDAVIVSITDVDRDE